MSAPILIDWCIGIAGREGSDDSSILYDTEP